MTRNIWTPEDRPCLLEKLSVSSSGVWRWPSTPAQDSGEQPSTFSVFFGSHFTLINYLYFQGKYRTMTWWWRLWGGQYCPSFGMWWRCSASYRGWNWCSTSWEGSREDCAGTSQGLTRTEWSGDLAGVTGAVGERERTGWTLLKMTEGSIRIVG